MTTTWLPYVIQQGDHVAKLAFRAGVDTQSVWEHETNKALADLRGNLCVLLPGDVLHLPSSPPATLDVTKGTKNRYRAAVPTMQIKVELRSDSRDLGGHRFVLTGAGLPRPVEGKLTREAILEAQIPITARHVEVRLPDAGLVVRLRVGDLDPVAEESGVVQRLRNLGYLPRAEDITADDLDSAVKRFQADKGLTVDGQLGAETRSALLSEHGC
ncbi:MAG: peptidoglycan-binding protein [Polyangiaceae bacterium]|nr:peptidoglycan-binding protein [Polyangiaceae bacterium]